MVKKKKYRDENRLEAVEKAFKSGLSPVENSLIKDTAKAIENGQNVHKSVKNAFKENDANNLYKESILLASSRGVIVGRGGTLRESTKISDQKKMSDYLYKTTLGRTKPPLFKTLKRNSFQQIAVDELNLQMSIGGNWTRTANALARKEIIVADVPKSMKELEQWAFKAYQSKTAEGVKAYQKALNQFEALSMDTASQGQLRKAYMSVISATKKGNEDAFKKAIKRAYKEKVRYNAQRIARSEIFSSYGQSFSETVNQDDNIGWVQFILDPAHPKLDECDSYASADLYGKGPGIYPKDEAPILPIHPNGRSILIDRSWDFVGGSKKASFDPKGMEKYLKDNPKTRRNVLGIKGEKEFNRNPSTWQKNMKGFRKPEKFVQRLPQ